MLTRRAGGAQGSRVTCDPQGVTCGFPGIPVRSAVVVLVDTRSGKPQPLPESVKTAVAALDA